MNYTQIKAMLAPMASMCENLPNSAELGEKAMKLIGDYPLYVSGLSNITYGEAIAIAVIMFGDIDKALADLQENDDLMKEFLDTHKDASADDYFKWVAEKKGAKYNG